ncbi:hypothetical protein P9139_16265 [Curtobacterium flaccumfaciens]|nr:hypothetical protein P9139_16265 [Curtobacterium flaccumfaciens]
MAAHDFLDAVHALTLPPTVVLIDDLDRMDVESQELIAFLASRLAGTALRVVATVRTVPSDGPLAALPTLRIEPLPADEALVLARAMAPEDANDGVLAVLAQETGGNPGALREQLAVLGREQLNGSEPLVLRSARRRPPRPSPPWRSAPLRDAIWTSSHDWPSSRWRGPPRGTATSSTTSPTPG